MRWSQRGKGRERTHVNERFPRLHDHFVAGGGEVDDGLQAEVVFTLVGA